MFGVMKDIMYGVINFFYKKGSKVAEESRSDFKKIYDFYLLESKMLYSRALNVYSRLEYLEVEQYIDGEIHSFPVLSSTIEPGFKASSEEYQSRELLFERNYPDLYHKYQSLKDRKKWLESIALGAEDDMGEITPKARVDIKRYYDEFCKEKEILDRNFKKQAKALGVSYFS